MNLYLIITLLVVAGPLLLSFDRKVAFYKGWKQLGLSMLPISAIYILWDILATHSGHWSFSLKHSGGWKLFGLPLGEWLFFFVVPYACIFIYEVVKAYFPQKKSTNIFQARLWSGLIGLLCLLLAVVFRDQAYTVLALVSLALWLAFTVLVRPQLLLQTSTLWYMLLSAIAFLLVNGLLTGIPIVLYNPEAIWGIRIITIPLEDLFYNIGMLGFFLLSYELVGMRLQRKGGLNAS
ncbi:MAG: lycopene cyclase domain-containing protein [Spirochaetia bacterium]|nr:lycopene cyclase domain-containing protein [Spirochaetia bacterium]